MLERLHHIIERWGRDEKGVAATEFAIVFPILAFLLIGTFDLGNGILVNQKTIAAAQTVADLISREMIVDDDMIDEAVRAGQLSVLPFTTVPFGVDIVSFEYDEDDAPQILWRETRNMSAVTNVENRVVGLGTSGDGVVAVIVQYDFDPVFSMYSIDSIKMEEVAFGRGRRSATVQRN